MHSAVEAHVVIVVQSVVYVVLAKDEIISIDEPINCRYSGSKASPFVSLRLKVLSGCIAVVHNAAGS